MLLDENAVACQYMSPKMDASLVFFAAGSSDWPEGTLASAISFFVHPNLSK